MTEQVEAKQETGQVEVKQVDDTARALSQEARKYRHRLRDVEAERDQLAAHVTALQDQIIGSQLGPVTPAAWKLIHPDNSAVLDETGAVDVTKLGEAIEAAKELLGLPAGDALSMRPDPSQGGGEQPRFKPSFEQAFDYKHTTQTR